MIELSMKFVSLQLKLNQFETQRFITISRCNKLKSPNLHLNRPYMIAIVKNIAIVKIRIYWIFTCNLYLSLLLL